MKFLFTIILVFILNPADASELENFLNSSSFETFCSNTLKYKKVTVPGTSEVRMGYLSARPIFIESQNYIFSVVKDLSSESLSYNVIQAKKEADAENKVIKSFIKPVRDMVTLSETELLFLFDSYLLVYNLSNEQTEKINITKNNKFGINDRAYSLAINDSTAYIANGSDGIIILNLETKISEYIDLGLIKADGQISLAVTVALTDDKLIVGVDNLTAPSSKSFPFNGFKTVSLQNNKVLDFPYNKRSSGVLVRIARTMIDKNILWINNWGTVQNISLNKFEKPKKIKVNWLTTIVKNDSGNWHYQPAGDFFIEGGYFYSCARKSDLNAGSTFIDKAVAFKTKVQ